MHKKNIRNIEILGLCDWTQIFKFFLSKLYLYITEKKKSIIDEENGD